MVTATAQTTLETVSLPEGFSLAHLTFTREGNDLIVATAEGSFSVDNYFSSLPPPSLTTVEGGFLSPDLVASFLQNKGDQLPARYALGLLRDMFGGGGEMEAIGFVVTLQGKASATRDGEVIELASNDLIFLNDIVSTEEGSKIFVRFTDKMEFRLGESASFTIDEYTYDDVSSKGLQVLSVIAGVFSYVSGFVAGENPASVSLQTPYGTIGIRGTNILGHVDEEAGSLSVTVLKGAVEVEGKEGKSAKVDEVAGDSDSFGTLHLTQDAQGQQDFVVETDSAAEVLQTYSLLDNNIEQLEGLLESGVGSGDSEEDLSGVESVEEEVEPEAKSESKSEPEPVKQAKVEEVTPVSVEIDPAEKLKEVLDIPWNNDADRMLSALGEGTSGNDILQGGDDGESFFGNQGNDRLIGAGGNDKLYGEAGSDRLEGGEGGDRLDGGGGVDGLYGGQGNDVLRGNKGDDGLFGGEGDDQYLFFVGDGRDTIIDTDGQNSIAFHNVQNLEITKSSDGEDLVLMATSSGGENQRVVVQGYYKLPETVGYTISYENSEGTTVSVSDGDIPS